MFRLKRLNFFLKSGGNTWINADFKMWYNLDKSFPAPATYFDMNSHLPDLIQPPKVAFEDKKNSAPIVWVLSNCGAFNGREKFVEKLMQYVAVHSYGNCLNNRNASAHLKQRMNGTKNFDSDIFDKSFLETFDFWFKFTIRCLML